MKQLTKTHFLIFPALLLATVILLPKVSVAIVDSQFGTPPADSSLPSYGPPGSPHVPTYDQRINMQEHFYLKKEFISDPEAWQVKVRTMEDISKSTIDFANRGFDGNPAFIQNIDQYLKGTSYEEGQRFLTDVRSSNMYEPTKNSVYRAISRDFGDYLSSDSDLYKKSSADTLSSLAGGDANNFYNDFNQGGWAAWYSLSEPQNDPISAYLQALGEASSRVSQRNNEELTKANYGNGFRSFEKCDTREVPLVSINGTTGQRTEDTFTIKENCQIQTPGKIIEENTNRALATTYNLLLNVNELGQINQTGSLSGSSQGGGSTGSQSFLDELMNGLLNSGLFGLGGSGSGSGGGLPPTPQAKQLILTDILESSRLEQLFIQIEQAIIAKLDQLKLILQNLLACYQSHQNQAGITSVNQRLAQTASSTLAASSSIAVANSNILLLTQIAQRVNSAQTYDQLKAAENSYNTLAPSLHNQDVVDAAQTYSTQLDTTITNTSRELSACQLGNFFGR